MKEQQPKIWKSVGERYGNCDIQANNGDRRLVDPKGVIVFEYKAEPIRKEANK